ncbi:hypothetical protein Q8F55_006563 [Vanrija albida]|uniref:Uncharacterized protein n=1 Tax=Vanrija albida TaxID=181172 RepID=A0ABR3PXH0_9TREE
MSTPAARVAAVMAYLAEVNPDGSTPHPLLARLPILIDDDIVNPEVIKMAASFLVALHQHIEPRLVGANATTETQHLETLYDRAVTLVEDYWPEIVHGCGMAYTDSHIFRAAMGMCTHGRPLPPPGSRRPSLLAAYLTPKEARKAEAPKWGQRGVAFERPLLITLVYLVAAAKIIAFTESRREDLDAVDPRRATHPRRNVARATLLPIFEEKLDCLRRLVLWECAQSDTKRDAKRFRRDIRQFARDRRAVAAELEAEAAAVVAALVAEVRAAVAAMAPGTVPSQVQTVYGGVSLVALYEHLKVRMAAVDADGTDGRSDCVTLYRTVHRRAEDLWPWIMPNPRECVLNGATVSISNELAEFIFNLRAVFTKPRAHQHPRDTVTRWTPPSLTSKYAATVHRAWEIEAGILEQRLMTAVAQLMMAATYAAVTSFCIDEGVSVHVLKRMLWDGHGRIVNGRFVNTDPIRRRLAARYNAYIDEVHRCVCCATEVALWPVKKYYACLRGEEGG